MQTCGCIIAMTRTRNGTDALNQLEELLMATSSGVASHGVSGGQNERRRVSRGWKYTRMMRRLAGLIFCDAIEMETQGMMTVLQTLLWWGLLCYLLRTSSAPSCFHSMVKKDKRGLNFSGSTLATESEHYVWCSDSVQTKGMSSSQHLQDNHCRL